MPSSAKKHTLSMTAMVMRARDCTFSAGSCWYNAAIDTHSPPTQLHSPMARKVEVVVGHLAVLSVSPAHPCCIALTRQSTHAGLQNKPDVFNGAAHSSDHTRVHTHNTRACHVSDFSLHRHHRSGTNDGKKQKNALNRVGGSANEVRGGRTRKGVSRGWSSAHSCQYFPACW